MNEAPITITVLFEAPALNRDEGAGNVQTIKKVRDYVYISRQAMTFYLRQTLFNAYGWKPAPVDKGKGKGEGTVIQFKAENEKAAEKYEELDAFGFMYTKGTEQNAVTRKARVAMTQAESLFPWQADTEFMANHGMIERAWEQKIINRKEPNPVNKETDKTLFKYSIVIDVPHLIHKEKITKDVVSAVINGLYYHVSGVNHGIQPYFAIAARVKLPMPVFHPFVDVKERSLSKTYTLEVELLKQGLENEYIERPAVIYHTEKVKVNKIEGVEITTSKKEFKKKLGIE